MSPSGRHWAFLLLTGRRLASAGMESIHLGSATNDLGWTKVLSKLSQLQWTQWGYVTPQKKHHPNPPMGNLVLG